MSKTDKDRPYAVRAFFEGDIDHDHRDGTCRTPDLTETVTPKWRRGRNHWRVCTRYEKIPEPCPGYSYWGDQYRDVCYTARRFYEENIERFKAVDDWYGLNAYRYSTRRRRITCGLEHIKRVYHPDWSCAVCEAERPPATCTYMLGWRERPYHHVPRWFTHARWHGPERVRVRDGLREMAKAYNAGDDLEDAEFVNSQHRHGASWDYY